MFAQIARDKAIMTKSHAQDIDYHHAGCRSVTLNYLQYLDDNEDEYGQYLWWHEWYQAMVLFGPSFGSFSREMCQLCEMIHQDLPPKWYDMDQWWRRQGQCDQRPLWPK